jgi:dTDP-glucose 4,6-dehydratase
VIPTIIAQIANGNRRIKLGALHPTRDFNYVTDTVAAFMAALRTQRAVGEVINIGSNFEISIGETARAIAELMQVEVELCADEQRLRPDKSEVLRLWASNEKARELLGWRPIYGGLDGFRRGLAETIAWLTAPAHLGNYRSDVYNL